MGTAFNLVVVMALAGCLFIPTFIAAIVMLKSVSRAFVLSGAFSLGAVVAGLLSHVAALSLLSRRHSEDVNGVLVMLFTVAGAAAGGVLTVLLLGQLSKYPPWRRY